MSLSLTAWTNDACPPHVCQTCAGPFCQLETVHCSSLALMAIEMCLNAARLCSHRHFGFGFLWSVQGSLSSIMGSLLAHRSIQKPSRPMTTEQVGRSSFFLMPFVRSGDHDDEGPDSTLRLAYQSYADSGTGLGFEVVRINVARRVGRRLP